MPEMLKFTNQGNNLKEKSIIDKVRGGINKVVSESRLPTKETLGYDSTMGIYGGKLVEDEEGRLVYDNRGVVSQIDRIGDRLLRTVDDHHVKEPGKMLRKHPKKFLKTLPFIADSKRYRGKTEQILENIHRLGLDDFYGPHPWGIEIKQPDVFKKGIGLQDIYRQDLIDHPYLARIDRFITIKKAGEYIKEFHNKYGAAGELNIYNIIFRKKDEEEEIKDPILMLPTIIYNPEKKIGEKEKKATDILDFLGSIAAEEWRRSKDWGSVEKALEVALNNYNEREIILLVNSLAKRGRLTLPDDAEIIKPSLSVSSKKMRPYFSAHNVQRLAIPKGVSTKLREIIINSSEKYLNSNKNEQGHET